MRARVTNAEGKHGKKHKAEEDEELSSLSGFSVSDQEENDDHDDLKFTLAPKNKKNYKEASDDEHYEEEHQDIVLNPRDDLKARFEHYEKTRKRNEEEKRQREILAAQDPDNIQNMPMQRPHTASGAMRSSETMLPKYSMTRQKENFQPQRPMTAMQRTDDGSANKSITFKAIYTKPMLQTSIEKKNFNYTIKNFKTIPKRSDPVSRYQQMNSQWNKSKFLKANQKTKEGRKLNLAERNKESKPENIFHRYQPKYVFEQH